MKKIDPVIHGMVRIFSKSCIKLKYQKMKKFSSLLFITLSLLCFCQENDSVFIYVTGTPVEDLYSEKYTSEKIMYGTMMAIFQSTTEDHYRYGVHVYSPYRNGAGKIINPIIIKEKNYLETIQKKWITSKMISSFSTSEFIEFFKGLEGKEVYVISQYYLDKYPDKVLIYKSYVGEILNPIY